MSSVPPASGESPEGPPEARPPATPTTPTPPPTPPTPPTPTPSAPRPALAKPARRPRWLIAALVGALVFGAGCWTEGCERLSFYRGEHDLRAQGNAELKDDGDRARVEALYKHWVDLADANRARAIPLAAATFVLGAALLALAGRGLTGRSNARAALIQVVSAQAIVVLATFFVLKDVRRAEWSWTIERAIAEQRSSRPPEEFEQAAPIARGVMRVFAPGWLVVRTVASALIVFALTRRRSRELFEAAADGVPEP